MVLYFVRQFVTVVVKGAIEIKLINIVIIAQLNVGIENKISTHISHLHVSTVGF